MGWYGEILAGKGWYGLVRGDMVDGVVQGGMWWYGEGSMGRYLEKCVEVSVGTFSNTCPTLLLLPLAFSCLDMSLEFRESRVNHDQSCAQLNPKIP